MLDFVSDLLYQDLLLLLHFLTFSRAEFHQVEIKLGPNQN